MPARHDRDLYQPDETVVMRFLRWAVIFDRPTDTDGAERLWRWSNAVDYTLAHAVMELAGYEPFAGFPLTRSTGAHIPTLAEVKP